MSPGRLSDVVEVDITETLKGEPIGIYMMSA